MTAPMKPWPPEDLIRLNELRAQTSPSLSWSEIGAVLNRSWAACKVQYFYQIRLKRAPKLQPGCVANKMTARLQGTFAAMEAREQIASLPPRSLTAEFFGDPLPGRSALDQMRAGQGDASRQVSLATGAER